jgi:PAS domain S-box-containing protein
MQSSAIKKAGTRSKLIFQTSKESDSAPASTAKPSRQSPDQSRGPAFDHLVQFYESDAFLADRVGEFIGAGFQAGEGGIIIGTPEHNSAIANRLAQNGLDLTALAKAGQYVALDAKDTLSQFMVKGLPDKKRFDQLIGGVLTNARNGQRRRVRAFGEMVALLWKDGNGQAAIQLEELWNELSRNHSFSLFCAYPMNDFGGERNREAFSHICHAHSRVFPTESYAAPNQTEEERLRAIAALEQKAMSLESEIEKRKSFEYRDRLFASIVQYSDDAIASKDLNGIITSWNAGAERIFGYTAAEIIGKSVTILIPPELQHEEPGILARLRRGERIDHYETIRRRKDGTNLEVSLTVSPLKDDTGKVIGASKIARDITERKRAEMIQQAIYDVTKTVNRTVDLREIYEAALSALCRCQYAQRAAILLYDNNGVMRFTAWRNLSDEYRSKVEGHSPWQRDAPSPQPVCLDDVSQDPLDANLRAAVRREGIRSLAFLPITYEGRLIGKFMIYYDTPHHFTPEELRPAQTIVTQVAFAIERRRTGENLERMVNERTASLREAIAQMEEFSYSVSHDLRAPVRAMQCYAEVLREDYGAKLDEPAKKYLDRIINGGARMDQLIQDILTYSRLSRREIKLSPISLDKITREIARQHVETIRSTHAEITLEGKLLSVMGHEASLTQAIANLLNNAVKFVAPGTKPKVRVWTERRNRDVRLWIEDNGIGIKPEYQHRLFSVFERIHPEKNYEGTGIGLAIVRKAAERMGGKAGVESDGVTGSKFWIQLPAAENS